MFGYYLELAFRNLKRNPGLTALMIGAVALGIAVCVMTLTMYRAMSGNPIWWKNDVLYAVTMDFWDPQQPADEDKPWLPPPQLTYRDAMAVYRSDIPKHKVIMHKAIGILSLDHSGVKPRLIDARVTSKDFFAAFDVPFQYGGTWTDADDSGPGPVMVISRRLNDELFGGTNSVGQRVRMDDNEYRIVGVRDHWTPLPTFYDVNNGSLEQAEDVGGCIVTDVRMPGLSGVDLPTALRERGVTAPVIVMTGHGDIALAVQAMKDGALDFVTKPLDDQKLLDSVHRALAIAGPSYEEHAQLGRIRERLASLSAREREVLDRVVAGKMNKVIADELDISSKTVEVHRARVMEKMHARNLAELVRQLSLVEAADQGNP